MVVPAKPRVQLGNFSGFLGHNLVESGYTLVETSTTGRCASSSFGDFAGFFVVGCSSCVGSGSFCVGTSLSSGNFLLVGARALSEFVTNGLEGGDGSSTKGPGSFGGEKRFEFLGFPKRIQTANGLSNVPFSSGSVSGCQAFPFAAELVDFEFVGSSLFGALLGCSHAFFVSGCGFDGGFSVNSSTTGVFSRNTLVGAHFFHLGGVLTGEAGGSRCMVGGFAEGSSSFGAGDSEFLEMRFGSTCVFLGSLGVAFVVTVAGKVFRFVVFRFAGMHL